MTKLVRDFNCVEDFVLEANRLRAITGTEPVDVDGVAWTANQYAAWELSQLREQAERILWKPEARLELEEAGVL